ncbi:Cys-tRNA(Pro) deacylase [Arthrobacter flavus]|uniref:Cys-tRNA(Pro)/Cys-tRNA(Cys) deacylase n=1 Tax=Arthrobacter flavus TaxID=95172 RepID=A0ABW4Q3W0_9MICC
MSRTPPATPATVALSAAGVQFSVRSYAHNPRSGSYGAEAVEALGVDPGRVFKTLMVDVDGTLTVAVVPVSSTLDLKALAAATGCKRAALADPKRAQRRTGYVLGGISPVGQRQPSPAVVDESALNFASILVSGGRRGFEIELAPVDLIQAISATVAPIAGLTPRA